MKIGVLGPLLLVSESSCPPLRAAKPRQMLALLLIRSNTLVSTQELIDEIWGTNPPPSAMMTAQTYIVQLRKMLAGFFGLSVPSDAKRILTTEYGGYMLRIPRHSLDLENFREQAKRGSMALDAGRNEVAASELYGALNLWRGQALADVQHGALLSTHVHYLEQCRMTALEQRLEADLRLGRHQALLSELTALTENCEFNESLHAKFMLALYRSGQRWKALSAFQTLRRSLVDELGLEPSVSLVRLHQSILNSDPALELPEGRSAEIA